MCSATGTSSSEGTSFVVGLPPAYVAGSYYDADLIVNARQTTDVTITTGTTSEVVTVYGNWSLHYGFTYSMRTTTDIEEKGMSLLRVTDESQCLSYSVMIQL